MARGIITCEGKGGPGLQHRAWGAGCSVVQALGDSAILWPPAASASPSAAAAGTGGLLPDPVFSPVSSCSLVMLLACQSDTAACSAVCYNKFTVPSKLSGKVPCQAA